MSYANLTNLRELNLHECSGVSDNGMRYLPSSLICLDLSWDESGPNITDEGMALLPPGLQVLNLEMNGYLSSMLDEDIYSLKHLPPGLKTLYLTRGFKVDEPDISSTITFEDLRVASKDITVYVDGQLFSPDH